MENKICRRYAANLFILDLWNSLLKLQSTARCLSIEFMNLLQRTVRVEAIRAIYHRRTGLLAALCGRLKGCGEKTLFYTYKTFICLVKEYRSIVLSVAKTIAWEAVTAAESRTLCRIKTIEPSCRTTELYETASRTCNFGSPKGPSMKPQRGINENPEGSFFIRQQF